MEELKLVKEQIKKYIKDCDDQKSLELFELLPEGKMLRSKLILKIAGVSEESLKLCAVVEMIHAASLLHDDVIDEADTRRGKPSINALYDNKTSIMFGDILYSRAFTELTLMDKDIAYTISNAVTLLSIGEMLDVDLTKTFNTNYDKYLDMIYKKTASLIEASAKSAALLSKKDEKAFATYGKNLGLAFQMVDDILDITSDSKTLGKPALLDFVEGKVTIPYLILYKKIEDKERLKNLYKKPLYEKDNRLWIKSSQEGDEKDRVVVRENGVPTYLAGDIIYHKNKYDRKYDKYINIWGADHHGYIARVKAAIKFLGNDPKKLDVLLSQMVSLLKGGEPYKMSKRAGNVILMNDVTEDIGADALRFVFLTKKSDTHLEFDVDSLKQQDSSNPVFYINYAHARVNQLFKKASLEINDVINEKLDGLNQEAKDLLYEALLLPSILEESFNKADCQKITEYLHSLASSLHKFYNEYKIVDADFQNQYLKVLAMVALSIRTGLKLLGITAKEVM